MIICWRLREGGGTPKTPHHYSTSGLCSLQKTMSQLTRALKSGRKCRGISTNESNNHTMRPLCAGTSMEATFGAGTARHNQRHRQAVTTGAKLQLVTEQTSVSMTAVWNGISLTNCCLRTIWLFDISCDKDREDSVRNPRRLLLWCANAKREVCICVYFVGLWSCWNQRLQNSGREKKRTREK